MEDKENFIKNVIEDFIEDFHTQEENENIIVNEITDDDIKKIIINFFDKKTLKEAETYFYDVLDEYIEDPDTKVNWNLERSELEKTPEYIAWRRHSDISSMWYQCCNYCNLSKNWAKVNGMAHTAEEAAKIAADKWCELIFDWHLQDNGALNENHGGGFPACALATILGENAKKDITEEMKQKAHELFQEYYRRLLHYGETYDMEDINWLKTTLKSKGNEYNWKYGFSMDMYCDYDPSWALYLILENAGIPENKIRNICPWKTGISIRPEDYMVLYRTYQHTDEL